MSTDPTNPGATVAHDGLARAFCATGCREAFTAEPGRYLGAGHR